MGDIMTPATFYETLVNYSKVNFIEAIIIGAMDGVSHDNIKDFTNNENWKFLFVEPVKVHLDKLKENFGKSDRFFYLNKAISEKNEMKKFLMFDPNKIDGTIVNLGMAGLTTIYPPKNCMQGFISEQYEDYLQMVEFECIPVTEMLEQCPLKNINYLQIDTEGYDWMIFKQFDISNIKFIKIEHSSLNESEKTQVFEKLVNNGFIYNSEYEDTYAIKEEIIGIYGN